LQSVSEWQRNKVDWSVKNASFSTLIGCHGNVSKEIKKEVWIEKIHAKRSLKSVQ